MVSELKEKTEEVDNLREQITGLDKLIEHLVSELKEKTEEVDNLKEQLTGSDKSVEDLEPDRNPKTEDAKKECKPKRGAPSNIESILKNIRRILDAVENDDLLLPLKNALNSNSNTLSHYLK